MTEKPFPYKKAFYDLKTNFIFQEEIAKILPLLINEKGIINVGGKSRSGYAFVKKFNPKIIKAKVNKKVRLPKGETDVEGFAKVVDSMYKICTQKNLITGKTPTPDDLADIKFPPSLKTALIAKGVKF